MEGFISDKGRLLKVEIYLKSYILVCVLVGYAFLDYIGILEAFSVPKTELGIVMLLFILISVAFLVIISKTTWFRTLVVIIAVSDIVFFISLIYNFLHIEQIFLNYELSSF